MELTRLQIVVRQQQLSIGQARLAFHGQLIDHSSRFGFLDPLHHKGGVARDWGSPNGGLEYESLYTKNLSCRGVSKGQRCKSGDVFSS